MIASSTEIELERLGWNAEFAAAFEAHAEAGLLPGRVAVQHRGGYRLYSESGELAAEASGRLHHDAAGPQDLPVAGDWVGFAPTDDGRAVVHAVLPRRTKFSRKAASSPTEEQVVAANVDTVFLVTGLDGDLSLRRLERYLTLAWESGAEPVVVLTKSDLCDDVEVALAEVEGIAYGVPVHASSAVSGTGVEELRRHFAGDRTVALLGSSGVGKSTLVNRLLGEELLDTQEVRADGRGRHTTTRRELLLLPGGGLVLDTPGMRELQLWSADEGVGETFADVEELAGECRFADCRHEQEPGCAVLAAVDGGSLELSRLRSYRKLGRELRALELKQDQRARSEEHRKRRVFARSQRKSAW